MKCEKSVETLSVLGKKWTCIIMGELAEGKVGFNTLLKKLKTVRPSVLSKCLKELENVNVIRKDEDKTQTPKKVSYVLTEKGRVVCDIIEMFEAAEKRFI